MACAVHRMRTMTESRQEIADQFGRTNSWVQHILRTVDDSGRHVLESCLADLERARKKRIKKCWITFVHTGQQEACSKLSSHFSWRVDGKSNGQAFFTKRLTGRWVQRTMKQRETSKFTKVSQNLLGTQVIFLVLNYEITLQQARINVLRL